MMNNALSIYGLPTLRFDRPFTTGYAPVPLLARGEDTLPLDRVEFTDLGQRLSQTEGSAPVRTAHVAGVRAAIARGEYESADKLDAVINVLMREL